MEPVNAGEWYRRWGKRAFDFALSSMAPVLLVPLLGFLALVVRLTLGTPVLFRQERPGRNGTPFKIFKFRTMTEAQDPSGDLLSDSQRITTFGRFLRATSFDELPELLNVVRGDMSLVGPRPLLMEYLDRYTPEQARRHEVKPGITGWAQVNGRNALTWEEKFRLDVWYVDHVSFLLDLKILLKTLGKVLIREGVEFAQAAEMPYFTGDSENDGRNSEVSKDSSGNTNKILD